MHLKCLTLHLVVKTLVCILHQLLMRCLCGQGAVPSGTNSSEFTCLYTSPVTDVDKGKASYGTNSDTSLSPFSSCSEPLNLTQIHVSRCKSEGNALICLRRKDYLTGTDLVLHTWSLWPLRKRWAGPKESIQASSSWLIAFNLKAKAVAVASNMYNFYLFYQSIMYAKHPANSVREWWKTKRYMFLDR